MDSHVLDKQEPLGQPPRPSYGRNLLLTMLLGGLIDILARNTQQSLSSSAALILGGLRIASTVAFVYFLGLWINSLVRPTCERCGTTRDISSFSANSTPTARDYCRLFGRFYYKEPLKLCFKCVLAQEAFLNKLIMLSIGHKREIEDAKKVWGDDAMEMLALLWTARENMDNARRILTEKGFAKARPWLEEQLKKAG